MPLYTLKKNRGNVLWLQHRHFVLLVEIGLNNLKNLKIIHQVTYLALRNINRVIKEKMIHAEWNKQREREREIETETLRAKDKGVQWFTSSGVGGGGGGYGEKKAGLSACERVRESVLCVRGCGQVGANGGKYRWEQKKHLRSPDPFPVVDWPNKDAWLLLDGKCGLRRCGDI